MKKPTIYQIRHGYERLAREEGEEAFFFSRSTMKFFGETMRDLKVEMLGEGIFSVRTRGWRYTFRALDMERFPHCYYRLE